MNNRERTLDSLEILGGPWCLDFANTINSRRQPEYDYLATYDELVKWTVRVRALPAERGERLQSLAVKNPADAKQSLQKAVTLRELLYSIFSKNADQAEPARDDLRTFVAFYAEAITNGELQLTGDLYTFDWNLADQLDSVLWPISFSAGELLLSDQWKRVKDCPNCGWLFLDASKNQKRRWCNMNTCGAQDKMRRYQHKLRQLKNS